MKRLHKIALSVVAMVAAMISGCGADEKNMPEVIEVIPSSTFSDGDKVLISFDDKHNEKNKIQSVVYLEGRRPCKILKQGSDDTNYDYKVELSGSCPPKDRLNTQSYKFKVQTKGGRYFCYEGNANINKATENTYPVGSFRFAVTYIHRVSCDK